MSTHSIRNISSDELIEHLDGLAQTLHASVRDGAAVSFVQPFSLADSRQFWQTKVLPALHEGSRLVLIAFVEGNVAGTVQLEVNLPPNQPHRCEVSKLLVHPQYRKRGIATALMKALETEARGRGKTLITLDTRTGDDAQPLYGALGYQEAGVIPDFALDPDGDGYHSTTYMFKQL